MNPQLTFPNMKLCQQSLVLALALVAATGFADYTIDWFTIDGGGGTIGQPDAGVMTNGNFTLQGGFWGVHDQMQLPRPRKLPVQPPQEFQELLMAMPGLALPHHFPPNTLQAANSVVVPFRL